MKIRGQGRVFPRGAVWWLAYHHRGQEIRESSKSRTPAAAVRLLKQRLGEIHARTYVGPSEERVTFDQLAEGYLKHYERTGLRSGSTAGYRVRNLRRFFAAERAVDITTARLTAYQDFRRAEQAEHATVNRELAALHRAFTLARKAKLITLVPEWPERLEENPPQQGFLEHPAYLAVRAELDADHQDALDFGYYSGWRKNVEVGALPWAMVDLDANELRLTQTFSKTKKGRVIPLPPPLRAVLLRRLAKRRLDCSLVFHHDGRRLNWHQSWPRACEAAGYRGQKFHDLRRTAVRNLDRAGVSRHVAMQLVGHKTEDMYRRYNIVSRQDLEEAGQKLAAYVATLPTTPTVRPLRGRGQTGEPGQNPDNLRARAKRRRG